MDVDLDQARRRAKELLRAARGGDEQARAALRRDRLPQLVDAQHAIARELGFASWPALARHAQGAGESLDRGSSLGRLDPPVNGVASGDAPSMEEHVVEPGPAYVPGRAVQVRVRIRGRRLDLDDFGAAVQAAGAPAGWLETAERVVAAAGLNVNRRGVVFLPAVAGRDVDALARKVADASLAVYQELLDHGP